MLPTPRKCADLRLSAEDQPRLDRYGFSWGDLHTASLQRPLRVGVIGQVLRVDNPTADELRAFICESPPAMRLYARFDGDKVPVNVGRAPVTRIVQYDLMTQADCR